MREADAWCPDGLVMISIVVRYVAKIADAGLDGSVILRQFDDRLGFAGASDVFEIPRMLLQIFCMSKEQGRIDMRTRQLLVACTDSRPSLRSAEEAVDAPGLSLTGAVPVLWRP